jgi:hypothetical protein
MLATIAILPIGLEIETKFVRGSFIIGVSKRSV